MKTFDDFFNNVHQFKERLNEFGYRLEIESLELPSTKISAPIEQLQRDFARRFRQVSLVNETARREFYIAPILMTVLDQGDFQLDFEYPITGENLQGTVDYLLRGNKNLIVIEAKGAEMERGFAQLAAEMLAAHEGLSNSGDIIYGAVTTGDLWRFGILDATKKCIRKDVNQYIIPQNLEHVIATLTAILKQ